MTKFEAPSTKFETMSKPKIENFKTFRISNFEFRIYQRGQSLVEVLIALTVATVILLSIVAAVILALKTTQISKHRSRATFLAQEGVEWLRSQRDRGGWDQVASYGSVGGSVYCVNTLPTSLATMQVGACPSNAQIESLYTRQVTLTTKSVTDVEAAIAVQWGNDTNGQPQTSKVITTFSNWEGANP